jgi:hypothetical protein
VFRFSYSAQLDLLRWLESIADEQSDESVARLPLPHYGFF